MPLRSGELTEYVMSRSWRSVKVEPSVTTYCTVCTLVASRLGLNTSESTPSATVNQTLEVLLRAVPTQSLRACRGTTGLPDRALPRRLRAWTGGAAAGRARCPGGHGRPGPGQDRRQYT